MSARPKNPTSVSMIVTGIVIALLFCGLAAFLILQRQSVANYDDVRKETRLKNLADLNASNAKALNEYRWVDKTKGIVGLPIARAMDLVVPELQANKPHPGGPIAAAPTPTPAGATTVPTGANPAEAKPSDGAAPAAAPQPSAPAAAPQQPSPPAATPAPTSNSPQPATTS